MSGLDYRSGLLTEYFKDYGFTPDPGVIASLVTAIGAPDQEGIVSAEVGAYINAVNQLQKAAANDPLQKILADENASLSADTASASMYASEAQDVYTHAPKLFGALTPDQIDQYLAPAKTAFDYSQGSVEGSLAARGLTGSSVEANALETGATNFNANVLSTGLNVGMTQQQNQAAMLQGLFQQYMAAKQNTAGLIQGTGTQISQQNYANAQFMAQLPLLLQAMATQQMQVRSQQDTSSFWNTLAGTLGSTVGGIAGGIYGGPMGAMAGASAGGSIGTGISSLATGEPLSGSPNGVGGASLPMLAYLLAGSKNKTTGTNMVPYSPTSDPGTMGTAGSSLLPPSLSYTAQPGAMQYPQMDPSQGMSWASQPGMLMGQP